jgi:putative DNA primase/helicase
MHDMHQTELARAMGPVARELLGEPNAALSSREELRFGSRGSLSVDRIKGMYFDHELGEGGGVIKFLQSRLRLEKEDAVAYLQERGHIQKPTAPNDSDRSKIVATYDYVAADGKLLFQVVRWEPKFFSQRPPDGKGGWRKGKGAMKGVERVIYRLPAVARCCRFQSHYLRRRREVEESSLRPAAGRRGCGDPAGQRPAEGQR